MFVRFYQDDGVGTGTTISVGETKIFTFEESDRLLNAFELTADTILLAMQKSIHLVKFVKQTYFVLNKMDYSELGFSICSATCFHSGF